MKRRCRVLNFRKSICFSTNANLFIFFEQKVKHDAEKSKDLEKKHKESVRKLKSKEEEIRMLNQAKRSAEQEHIGAMTSVQVEKHFSLCRSVGIYKLVMSQF